jgi:hypothetical protein
MNILFYTRHVLPGKGCRIEDTGGGGYSRFCHLLKGLGHHVTSQYGLITRSLLTEQQVVVIPRPCSEFDAAEVTRIGEYVENGGGVLLMHHEHGDRGNGTNLNTLSRRFGIRFNNDLVGGCERFSFRSGWLTRPVIHDLDRAHPIVQGVSRIWYWGCSIKGGTRVASVCPRGVSPGKVVISAKEGIGQGKGRVLCIGSSTLLINDEASYSPYYRDEFRLGINAIYWLGKQPVLGKSIAISKIWFVRRPWLRLKGWVRSHQTATAAAGIALALASLGASLAILS